MKENKYSPFLSPFNTVVWLFITHILFPVIGIILIVTIIAYELIHHFITQKYFARSHHEYHHNINNR